MTPLRHAAILLACEHRSEVTISDIGQGRKGRHLSQTTIRDAMKEAAGLGWFTCRFRGGWWYFTPAPKVTVTMEKDLAIYDEATFSDHLEFWRSSVTPDGDRWTIDVFEF